jgi:N-acetylmuramoyl-L-alanine amidase
MAEPDITRMAAHHGHGSNLPVTRVVVHATAPDVGFPKASQKGAATGSAKNMAKPSTKFQAHYIEGIDVEEHCVPDKLVALHAPPNAGSIGVEITADGGDKSSFKKAKHAYTREQWMSDLVFPAVVRAAGRVRELCERHGVPKRRLTVDEVKAGKHGICGHIDVSLAFHQTTHTDPGPNFPWDEFMAMVNGADPLLLEDDMPEPKDLWAYDQEGARRQAWSYLQSADANARRAAKDSASALEIVKEMARVGRSLTAAEVEAAAKAGAAAAFEDKIDDADVTLRVQPQN